MPIHPPPTLRLEVRVFSAKKINAIYFIIPDYCENQWDVERNKEGTIPIVIVVIVI
jgi:hypothetical protein